MFTVLCLGHSDTQMQEHLKVKSTGWSLHLQQYIGRRSMQVIYFISCLALVGLCLASVRSSKEFSEGIHLPIQVHRLSRSVTKRDVSTGSTWLGDYKDIIYSVLVTIGSVQMPLVLDTGSSDLWLLSDACTNSCGNHNVPMFPIGELNYSGTDVRLGYGDSKTGTHASGPIGSSEVSLAGISMMNQYFAAINDTNTNVTISGNPGILGLGFPINSVIFNVLYESRMNEAQTGIERLQERSTHRLEKRRQVSLGQNNMMSTFPTLPARLTHSNSTTLAVRQMGNRVGTVEDVLASFSSIGSLVSRMAQTGELASPQVTITMQRDSIDIGGNLGILSLGSLPPGILRDSLTWVPIRAYTPGEGGLPAPSDSPNETYPIAWEIHVDGVYLDGVKLPKSNLSNPAISTTALVDTGNSLIRGPADVIAEVHRRIGATQQGLISCTTPYTLAFEIGGQMFSVDPRDFIAPSQTIGLDACWPNIVSTDPPATGFLYSWSLGDPFLKSTLASFYYGNLTYPSMDPPRIGFLSTVPGNANELFGQAVSAAQEDSNEFPVISVPAPSVPPSGLLGYGTNLPTHIKAPAAMSPSVTTPSSSTPDMVSFATSSAQASSTSFKQNGGAVPRRSSWSSLAASTAFICILSSFW